MLTPVDVFEVIIIAIRSNLTQRSRTPVPASVRLTARNQKIVAFPHIVGMLCYAMNCFQLTPKGPEFCFASKKI